MRAEIDKRRFGPWAVITGASSGIGKEFARQIAASGVHVASVARRESLLRTVGAECTRASGVQHRIIPLDLSEPDFLPVLADATRDLDVGLVVSNAGTGSPGRFLDKSREELMQLLRLNTAAQLDIARHFGERLVLRGSGGLIFELNRLWLFTTPSDAKLFGSAPCDPFFFLASRAALACADQSLP